MPRTRLLLLIWAFGIVMLLGMWGHSLFRKTILRYSSTDRGFECSAGIVAGSFEFFRRPIGGRAPTSLKPVSIELKEGKILPHVPTYKFGRFHYSKREVTLPRGSGFVTTVEFPLWLLALLWSLLCYPLYRRYARKQRGLPPGTAPPPTDSP